MIWDDYRFLLAISRAQGLPGAAESLGVTISTVYRRLEKLESEIGGPVFVKSRSGYQPNDAGAVLIRHAARIEEEVISAERYVSGQDAQLCGDVTITASEVLTPFFVAKHIAAIRQLHSDLNIEIFSGNQTLDLASGEADIAFRPVRPNDGDLFGRKIADIHWGIYGRRRRGKHALVFNDLAAISRQEFVGFGGDPVARLAMLRQRTQFPGATVGIKTNSLISTANVAANSSNLALLPCLLGEQWSGLCCFAAPMKHQFGELWMVCHKDLRRNARVRTVFDFFISAAQEDSKVFLGPS